MAIRVHKENANKQGKELYGGRNNHRRVKKRREGAGDDTRELGECKEREKTRWAEKRDKKREEM